MGGAASGEVKRGFARYKDYLWPLIGLVAVAFSGWLLYTELRSVSLAEVVGALRAIPPHQLLLALASTLVAYAALAWYDRIALLHLGKALSWPFIAICSFTTYALSHTIGASVFSGAVVRYRAYSSVGLRPAEIAVLVALCSFTFGLGVVLLGGLVLTVEPEVLARLSGLKLPAWLLNETAARVLGAGLLAFVALYVAGSLLDLKPLKLGSFRVEYPRPPVTLRQLVAAPLELVGAAGIIHFALPDAGHPGFLVVLAVFLAAFALALASNAPGGLGVFEFVFITAVPEMDKAGVLAALLVFRLLYLLIPFAFALVVVALFERGQMARRARERALEGAPGGG